MSFANRMKANRPKGGLIAAALAASIGMGGIAAQPVAAPSATQAPREFVRTEPRKAKKPAPVANRVKPKRNGDGHDSRKARRRLIMQLAGRQNSGRQWKKVRRVLRQTGSAVLIMPAWKLAILAASHVRVTLPKGLANA